MSQKDEILQRLRAGQTITPLDAFLDSGIRSLRLGARIWDLRKAGYDIESLDVETRDGKHVTGYRLRNLPPPDPDDETIRVFCGNCGKLFEPRARDVKRGLGRYCTRRCSGAQKGKPRADVESLAPSTEAVQVALL